MTVIQDFPTLPFDLAILNSDLMYLWGVWRPFTGVTLIDFAQDIRNLQVGTAATVSVKPAIQYAVTRVDRMDDGAVTSAGSVATGNGLTKYQETPSGASKYFFRTGIGYRLTAGNFARIQGKLDCNYRQAARILAPEEFPFNPTNSTTDWSIYPFNNLRPIPANSVDKLKLAVIGSGNANNSMEYQPVARCYNDPQARGDWTLIGASTNPAAGDFDSNTGEIALSGLTPASYQFIDVGLAVHKATGGASNTRCHFRVLPSLKLS